MNECSVASARTRPRRRAIGIVVLSILLAVSSAASAQETVRVQGTLVGRVVTRTGEPLENVNLDIVGTYWRTTTRRDGFFALGLPPGRWSLRARRLGHVPVTSSIVVESTGPIIDTLRVVLGDVPNDLRGIVVTAEPGSAFVSTMTTETVRHAPALGEADILRLLPMLPAIAQPNDVIGRLHFAGGASDEHAVYLDGHPLQAPYHVHSVIGAFNVAALDRADVLIHHLPSAREGRLSGAIDLESRRPSSHPTREVVVSLLSSSLTVAQPALAGGVDLLASGRVTYLDKVLREYVRNSGRTGDDLRLPSYRDGVLKLARVWESGWSLEALGYGSRDAWADSQEDSLDRPLRWGEAMAGLRASYRGKRWHAHTRLSTDRAFAGFRRSYDPLGGAQLSDTLERTRIGFIDLTQRWTSGAVELRRVSKSWQAIGGATLDERRTNQRWGGPRADDLFKSAVPADYDARDQHTVVGLFGEGALQLGSRWTTNVGAHVSLAGRARIAPRLLVSAQVSPTTRMHLAVDRRHQFDAIAGEPREGSITQPVFLLRTPRVADMIALSATWRASERRRERLTATIDVYARRHHDRLVSPPTLVAATTAPPPSPSRVGSDADVPPGMNRVPGTVVGASVASEFALAGGTVFHVSYTAQRSREEVDGRWRPTAWDAPHQLGLFAGVPLGSRWMLTGTGQFRSGTAVTPVAVRLFVPLGGGRYAERFTYGEAHSARLPSYARIDLGLRHTRRARGAEWALSLQALNVLARTNVLEYDWRNHFVCAGNAACEDDGAARKGLPVMPSVGLEVRW